MSEDIKKGLMGVTVDETAISKVMPEINSLTYRGYAAQDLCAKCKFEEVAYLILNGELPNNKQLKDFEKQESKERLLSKSLISAIKSIPRTAHPMDVARTAVSIMGLEDKETKDNSPKANMRKVMRIFAKMPVALAAFYRTRKGKKIIPPKKKLSFSENLPIGSVAGEFNATDADEDILTFHFVSGENNNSLFTLDQNGTLRTAVMFDFENNASNYTLQVEARDSLGASVQGIFTVSLLDVFEIMNVFTC